MSKTVEFFFDVGSPTSYLAWTQIRGIAERAGAEVAWRPVLVGAVFQATGNASPVTVPAKAKYMLRDLARYAARYGVPFTFNPKFPINTLTLMRGATGLQMRRPDALETYLDAVFRAFWADAADMGDPAVVGGVLAGAGLDPREILALASDQEVKDRLKADTEAAVARGLFGVPTFLVGKEMFFGQDRLDFVAEALA